MFQYCVTKLQGGDNHSISFLIRGLNLAMIQPLRRKSSLGLVVVCVKMNVNYNQLMMRCKIRKTPSTGCTIMMCVYLISILCIYSLNEHITHTHTHTPTWPGIQSEDTIYTRVYSVFVPAFKARTNLCITHSK